MRPLTDHEKKTVRLAGVGVGVYLLLFGGYQGWRYGEAKRSEYQNLVREATNLRLQVDSYKIKGDHAQKLVDEFQMDPLRLASTTMVAQASAAIQNAAKGGGLAVGAVRETGSRAKGKELATIQLEAMGPVPAATAFLFRVQTVGYPVLIDSAQITAEPSRPGQVKLNLTLLILDFEQWKQETSPHA